MVATPPADQAARDRIHADLDATLFVEAGAGTGKTRELIERVLRLVASGRTELRRIAAITFTEAAAAELRDRIRVRLEEAAQDETLPLEERSRCRDALAQVDAAAIETLHGFAQRILSEHPLEAGIPPLIDIQDDIQASIAFDERWAAYVDELLNDESLEEVLLRAFSLGLELKHLREAAWEFHQHWDRLEAWPAEANSALPSIDASPVVRLLDEACRLRRHCADPDDGLYRHLGDLEAYRDRLAAAAADRDRLRTLAERKPLRGGNKGRRENWVGVTTDQVREPLARAEQLRDELLREARSSLLPPLLAALQRFVLQYADERRRQGRLEFHDLLVQARDLLYRDPAVRRDVRERFSHLLIDEFQDTDPLQIDIAVLLAGNETHSAPPPWHEAAIEDGRLFFVGDPKQSIYRFRRADIALYQRAQRRFSEQTVRLTQNFRSLQPVIDWVNHVFQQLMGDGAIAGQATYVPLHASWPSDGAVTVRLLGGAASENVPLVREREAKELASLIQAAKAEGWPVTETDANGGRRTRPVRFSDIALLMPTRTTLPPIEEALEEAGIPYRVESRSLVYDTQEVRDLLSILRAIDDPTDEVALIAALRSPAFACADNELLRFYQAGGRWDYRHDPPPGLPDGDPVVEAMAALHDLHRRRWWEPISGIVEEVIRERRLFELAFAHRRPRERWQRLRFVLDQARAFAEAGGRTLRRFIDWAERQADEGTRVVETVVPEPDDDAVRIMTIHAAKGLEFPIVVLTGLNIERTAQRKRRTILWDEDGRPEARLGSGETAFETPGYAQLAAHEETLEQYEKVRLLYVAATRARDHLVVSLHHRAEGESQARRLHGLAAETRHLWQPAEEGEPPAQPAERAEPLPFDDGPDQRRAWLEARQQRLEQLSRVRAVAATAIAARAAGAGDDPNLRKDAPAEESPPWRRGRAGTALGRAVHAVLQSIDLATGAGVESAARAQAAAEGISDRSDEVARMVAAALQATSVREAVAGGRYWRELYVGAPVDGVTVEGFIDLLYETPDGLVIVDYKTDVVPSEAELEEAMARYQLQGASYALALQEALGRAVARCVFVFVQPKGARERAVEDLPVAIEAVREELRRGA